MDKLLLKYYSGEITAEEKQTLFDLIEGDESLKKEFIELQSLTTYSRTLPMAGDEEKAEPRLQQFKQERRMKRILLFTNRALRYAAVVCITIALSWYLIPGTYYNNQLIASSWQEFITPAGQRAQVKLPDGTSVWLNAGTTLRYPLSFSRTERRVELDGEAFFEVESNKEVPFIVSTEKIDIKVHGTTFNVCAYNQSGEFTTALTEGSIELFHHEESGGTTFLKPNESVKLVDGQLIKSEFDNKDFLLWTEGTFACDDEPFHEIIKKLERYYDINIEIKNEELYEYRFSGKFRQRDGVESILSKLNKVYSFRFIRDDRRNTIIIL